VLAHHAMITLATLLHQTLIGHVALLRSGHVRVPSCMRTVRTGTLPLCRSAWHGTAIDASMLVACLPRTAARWIP
jgi:hypothetical protein